MGDIMVVDVPEMKGRKSDARKCLKRKRAESLSTEEREARIGTLREEVDGLLKYYQEFLEEKKTFDWDLRATSNAMIACLLEESTLPLSKLVDKIYEKLKGSESFGDSITLVSVKSSVLLIGQRSLYGLPNPDVDVLEDDTPSCLWCWETRDVKLLPKSVHGTLKIRRTCRKKIHGRITAVSALITELLKSESHPNGRQEAFKASERLGKLLSEAEIRLLVASMVQKNSVDMAEKEVKREEKLLVKQLEKSKREVEKEKKRIERELQKEKLQSEKDLKRLQEEAEKEERRHEKEESETRKQIRRQQEEAEKDQRRREKEEAELKKQLALQKQASLLERFLKKNKDNLPLQSDQSSTKPSAADMSPNKSEKMPESVTQAMDYALSLKDGIAIEDIWKLHLVSWNRLGHSMDRKQHWGIRRMPKTEVVKELKLTTSRGLPCDDESTLEKLVDGWSETKTDCRSCSTKADGYDPTSQKCSRSKQLLQFDKSHRPAFYGIWPKKSQAVRARRPMVKDPYLDYEIDSDEEWEEEEPGESLSDCDKDDEESLEEGFLKADDEDESEDGFFVPDGYLSENEQGVQAEIMDCNDLVEEARSSPSCKEVESEELHVLLQQHKYLHNLTEQALRKNRPLLILNLMHEKAQSSAKDLTATLELEQMCLQTLSIHAFPVGPSIVISVGNDVQEEDQEDCTLSGRGSTTPVASAATILDSDLPQIVSVIQSCSQGITKVVESLHQKFPTVSKSQLRNKVREMSNFTDNRWQVKKDILEKLGLPTSPDKSSRRCKNIATFFSKRCLPPAGKTTINPNEIEISISPHSLQKKPQSVVELQQNNTFNHQ